MTRARRLSLILRSRQRLKSSSKSGGPALSMVDGDPNAVPILIQSWLVAPRMLSQFRWPLAVRWSLAIRCPVLESFRFSVVYSGVCEASLLGCARGSSTIFGESGLADKTWSHDSCEQREYLMDRVPVRSRKTVRYCCVCNMLRPGTAGRPEVQRLRFAAAARGLRAARGVCISLDSLGRSSRFLCCALAHSVLGF